jgi:hypothetical protein
MDILPLEMVEEIVDQLHPSYYIKLHKVNKIFYRICYKKTPSIISEHDAKKAYSLKYYLSINKLLKILTVVPFLKFSCLRLACIHKQYKLVTHIIDNFDNIMDNQWNGIYRAACQGGDQNIITLITKKGYDLYKKVCSINEWYTAGLEGAALGGHRHIFVSILTRLKNTNSVLNEQLLEAACEGGNEDIVKIVKHKVGINLASGFIAACLHGHKNIFNMLYNIISKNPMYDHLECWIAGLSSAFKGNHTEIINFMINVLEPIKPPDPWTGRWNEAFYGACYSGNTDLIKMAIKKGAGPNGGWNRGLEGACEGGQLELVKSMIKKGAAKIDNENLHRCLLITSMDNHYKIQEYLISKGASFEDDEEEYSMYSFYLLFQSMEQYYKDFDYTFSL